MTERVADIFEYTFFSRAHQLVVSGSHVGPNEDLNHHIQMIE